MRILKKYITWMIISSIKLGLLTQQGNCYQLAPLIPVVLLPSILPLELWSNYFKFHISTKAAYSKFHLLRKSESVQNIIGSLVHTANWLIKLLTTSAVFGIWEDIKMIPRAFKVVKKSEIIEILFQKYVRDTAVIFFSSPFIP